MRFIPCMVLAAGLLASCALPVPGRFAFQPQPLRPIDGRPPDGGMAGEELLEAGLYEAFGSDGAVRAVSRPAIVHETIETAAGPVALTVTSVPGRKAPLTVHCGGNATDRWSDGTAYTAKALFVSDVIVWDYPGYGDSGGRARIADALAAVDGLVAHVRARQPDRAIAYWGHSLGGFLCAEAAARDPGAAALVLEATASDAAAAVRAVARGPLRLLNPRPAGVFREFDIPGTLKGKALPILVFGAEADDVLPWPLAQDLARHLEADGHDVTFVLAPGAGHFGVPATGVFARETLAFYERYLGLAPPPGGSRFTLLGSVLDLR